MTSWNLQRLPTITCWRNEYLGVCVQSQFDVHHPVAKPCWGEKRYPWWLPCDLGSWSRQISHNWLDNQLSHELICHRKLSTAEDSQRVGVPWNPISVSKLTKWRCEFHKSHCPNRSILRVVDGCSRPDRRRFLLNTLLTDIISLKVKQYSLVVRQLARHANVCSLCSNSCWKNLLWFRFERWKRYTTLQMY